MRLFIFFLLFLIVFSCKKKSDPSSSGSVDLTVDTIFPGSYAPYYPGSSWLYQNLDDSGNFSGSIRKIEVDKGYHPLAVLDSAKNTDTVLLPRIILDTASQNYRYIHGYYDVYTEEKQVAYDLHPYLVFTDYNKYSLYMTQWGAAGEGKFGGRRDSVVVGGVTYHDIVIWLVKDHRNITIDEHTYYYAYDVGLVKIDMFYQDFMFNISGRSSVGLKSYFINR